MQVEGLIHKNPRRNGGLAANQRTLALLLSFYLHRLFFNSNLCATRERIEEGENGGMEFNPDGGFVPNPWMDRLLLVVHQFLSSSHPQLQEKKVRISLTWP